MEPVTRIQILMDANCISHITNTIGKVENPATLTPTMGE